MRPDETEVLDRDGNFAVVHLAGRAYPGVFVQGDTMATIRDLLRDVREDLLQGVDDDVADGILEARDRLNDLMVYYESVLQARHIRRPY